MAGPCCSAMLGCAAEGPGRNTHVVCKAQHDLRSPVPPRRDILSHEALVRRGSRLVPAATSLVPSREAEIADLELAVSVYEEVTRLEITVEDVRGMNVFEAAERLVDEGLEVRVGEWLLGSDLGRAYSEQDE